MISARHTWADKSQAAIEREQAAIKTFQETFLPQARQATSFPFTIEGLIAPENHLTDACWRTFKQTVVANGCTAKRREITPMEKHALRSKARKGKMYAINVSIACHPDQAVQKLKEKQAKADLKKKEKEEAKKLKEQQEKDLKALVEKEYSMLEEQVFAGQKRSATGENVQLKDDIDEAPPVPAKKLKLEAPVARLIQRCDTVYSNKKSELYSKIAKEKAVEKAKLLEKLDESFQEKTKEEVAKLNKECDYMKQVVKDASEGKEIPVQGEIASSTLDTKIAPSSVASSAAASANAIAQ